MEHDKLSIIKSFPVYSGSTYRTGHIAVEKRFNKCRIYEKIVRSFVFSILILKVELVRMREEKQATEARLQQMEVVHQQQLQAASLL